ncbi:MAG: NAD-dependent succinate-semialdehyde dehydrogenase [Deltaproteobacteria bacterium]|nr:NAD-dependent succinate-semialdehyde dehydrogenase [Deltaproteobacteria bacterium]
MFELRRDAYVNGRWEAGTKRFAVRDPYDGAPVAEVTDADDAMIDAAVAAAVEAFPAWRAKPGPARGRLLRAMAAAMEADAARLAELCVRENGKAMAQAAAEVTYAASFLVWFAGEAERMYGEIVPASQVGQRIEVTREPVGPCALITPWNFPYAMLTRKLGAALAAGCTVVCKPAEQTPLGALAIAQLAEAAGVPEGVVNVVPAADGARAGGRLVAAPGIRKVSFTGSTEVGKLVAAAAVPDLKRVSLELGGNAPFVVLADADLEAAVAGAMIAKFRNAGQSCVAANRFIVEAPVAEAFTGKLIEATARLRVGRGSDAGVDLGPLVDDASARKVARLVADAVSRGALVVYGEPPDGASRLVKPVVLAGITPAMAMWREEIFGPVVGIRVAADEADALAQANDTDAGLVAYVYTRDGARQARAAAAIESGMIGINEGLVSTAQAPFGGIKQSGIGREGSRHGLDDYTSLKYVMRRP